MPPLRFLLIVVALIATLHLYLAIRLVPDLPLSPVAQWGAFFGLFLSAVLQPVGLLSRALPPSRWRDLLAWLGPLCMGLFSSLFVLTLLRDALLCVAFVMEAFELLAPDMDALATGTAVTCVVLALCATSLGFINARRLARVVEVDVPIARLPAGLQGFRIAQISDVHVGPTIRQPYLSRIVQAVNRLQPDLVAITGDLVDGRVSELREHVAPLADLQARHGSFFVTGNHEYYSGAHEWIAELRRLGLRVLLNEHVALDHDGAGLVLAGVTDYGAGTFDPAHRSDPQAALGGAPSGVTRILLAHQPRSAGAAARAGFDLQLSGHTHGGQFWPWNLFVPLQQPFTAGLHRLQNLWIYVSRGTGYWGPPKRFGAPSEITCLRLVAA